jgi:hypothetical protein
MKLCETLNPTLTVDTQKRKEPNIVNTVNHQITKMNNRGKKG